MVKNHEVNGDRIGDIVDRLQQVRETADTRATTAKEGVLLDQLEEVRTRLLEFGRALGGAPTAVSELPFTEEATRDQMPEPLYVRHDQTLLNQVTSWLLQGQHIGVVSPYGTGKTSFREIVRRDLGAHEDFVIATIPNAQDITPRQLYQTIIKAAFDAGYELDTDQYWQTRDGIPWATDDARQAVGEIAEQAEETETHLYVMIDEIEVLPAELLSPLQVAGDLGARLFLMGTSTGKERIQDLRETLDSRIRYYEGIAPFSRDNIAEYIARSLAHFRGDTYDGQGQQLFTATAIDDIHTRTDGNPREVRIECRELFTRAAFVWYRTGQAIDRIQVTPELRHQRFGMEY